jgi:hypothetical protein
MSKFWGTTKEYKGCTEAPDGLSHSDVYIVQKWRFWLPYQNAYHSGQVGTGPCPRMVRDDPSATGSIPKRS